LGKGGESLGKDLEAKFGPDSEFAKKLKEKAGAGGAAATPGQSSSRSSSSSRESVKPKTKAVAKIRSTRRERRIKELEAQIKKLMDEVKALEESGDQDDDNGNR